MNIVHELKVNREYYVRLVTGDKTFEIRKNDRDFQVGDELHLREWMSKRGEYCDYSQTLKFRICYMTSYMQQEGYVVLGLEPKEQEKC